MINYYDSADALAYALNSVKSIKHKPGYRGYVCTGYGNTVVAEKKPLPNEKCPCGSNKKYKYCCG